MKAMSENQADIEEIDKYEAQNSQIATKMRKIPIKGHIDERREALRELMENPPSSNRFWNTRVDEYTAKYNEWMTKPQPKQPWEGEALTHYRQWEIPLLEKGRKLNEAEQTYTLSENEEDMVNQQFAQPGDAISDDGYVPVFDAFMMEVEENEQTTD
jgi:hypothetical protein